MARSKVKLDHKGIADMLRSPAVRSAVRDLANRIAQNVRGAKPEADVVVDDYTTDRAAASVTIRDAAGRVWQVRDGVLTKAAAAEGAEVRERR